MNHLVTAALMMCHTGDPVIAGKIVREAARQDTNAVVALAIGILESGLGRGSHDNPMGVRGCYPKAKKENKRTTDDCIRIGVASIRNRLSGVRVTTSTNEARMACAGSGNLNMCRALIIYNGADKGRKFVYAKKAMGIICSIYRILGSKLPNA